MAVVGLGGLGHMAVQLAAAMGAEITVWTARWSTSAPPPSLNVSSLIGGRRSYAGSMIGGIAETQEMLDSCGERGVSAGVEVIAAERINDAYERVLASDVRYRFVIDAATLR